ncbi:Oidioi.mRNA.OKI2018_I69.chr2.g7822.t1.cds [Oikopleura dioica]|uniref:Oidioi.mRNA.OKI2018_I69.chr2.g7822.t1.cds n=1 Tax=Oikopleura dioica TaxID=34765 RepID=A0ABN7TAT9_OIKDI|nr:Oidioi.mRNA.OKI2018_I69.chr2.g7822.t1.cds [Oikopleura dioica]
MEDFSIHSVVKNYNHEEICSNITPLLSPARISVIGYNPQLKCALLCSKYHYHVLNLAKSVGGNEAYKFSDSDVCRRERTTNFEHKFDPSVVKFSNEKYSGLFATLCKTEMIEVNQLVPTLNEETLTQSYSVRRLLAENNRPISHSRYVNDIAWSNKGNKLASVCKDSNLKVWSVTEDSIKLVNRFNTVSQASFVRWDTKENNRLATTIDRQLKFWDLRQLRQACEWFYMDDQRANNIAKSIDINENYVLSLMTQGGAANKPVLCVHDRRRPLEGDTSKRTKKMKLFSTTVPGAREARFSADGKHVLVLVDDGRDSETTFAHVPMGRSSANSQYRSSSIKIFSIDGPQQSANHNIPKQPISSISSQSMIINWQQIVNGGDDGDSRIIGFTKELDAVDRVHQINFHRWKYKLTDDDDEDMFKDFQATSDLGNETLHENSENPDKSTVLDALLRDLEGEVTLIRKNNQYGIQISKEIGEGAVVVKFTTNTHVKVSLLVPEGYPKSAMPSLLSAAVPAYTADEQIEFKKDLEQTIRMKTGKFVLESIYIKLSEVVRSLRNSNSESVVSVRSEALKVPTASVPVRPGPGPTFSKHEMKNAPFPARCGTCWCSDKLVVWANKKVSFPSELPIIPSQSFNIKRHSVTAEHGRAAQMQGFTYQYFFNLAQPKLGESTDHSPRSRVPYLRNIGLTRQGSIDGRQVQNLQKYPPLRVELHSIAPLTNLSRVLAERYSIPTISENMAIIQPSEIYRLDDVFRIELVKRNLAVAKAHIKSISDESFGYSVIVWSTLRTILQYWQNFIEKSAALQEENLFNFKFHWLPNARMIIEKIILTGDKKIETQTLAILASYLSSVPYFEDNWTQEINQKSLISLLKLSPPTVQILHTHVQQYSRILDSWKMFFERTKLVKSMFAETMIQSHLTDKSRLSPASKEMKSSRSFHDRERQNKKITKLLGMNPPIENIEDSHCQCERCNKCNLLANIKCTICRQDILGLSWCCVKCNHNSHIACQEQWFDQRERCPNQACFCECKTILDDDSI